MVRESKSLVAWRSEKASILFGNLNSAKGILYACFCDWSYWLYWFESGEGVDRRGSSGSGDGTVGRGRKDASEGGCPGASRRSSGCPAPEDGSGGIGCRDPHRIHSRFFEIQRELRDRPESDRGARLRTGGIGQN